MKKPLKLCSESKKAIPCLLGKGHFGLVTLQKQGDKKYAKKTLKNQKYLPVFEKQYKNLQELKKKNICEKFICLFGDNKNPHEIKMEYLENYMELFYYIEKQKSKSLVNMRIIADSLLKAMKELHENGFVHCDLKPENIMVLYDETMNVVKDVRIIDFGGMIMKESGKNTYSMNVYTIIFQEKKPKYTWKELIEHDYFCMGITLCLLMGYHNDIFKDIYTKFVNYGVYVGSKFSDLNIFQQLNVILYYYLNVKEKLFREDYSNFFDKKMVVKQPYYSNINVFKKKFLNFILSVYEEKIFRGKQILLKIKNLYDIDFEFPKT